jgi:hypothetical protein
MGCGLRVILNLKPRGTGLRHGGGTQGHHWYMTPGARVLRVLE